MDKIKKEFEKWYDEVFKKTVFSLDYEDNIKSYMFICYKSRDEEIKKLIKKYEKILPDYNLRKAEIFLLKEKTKKLRDALKWVIDEAQRQREGEGGDLRTIIHFTQEILEETDG